MDAKILVVGNEILSGKTRDTNSGWLAEHLTVLGITVSEIRVVPDIEELIAGFIADQKDRCDFLFVMGGIGPTHDDLTRQSLAAGLRRALVTDPVSVETLKKFYGDKINDARLRMAQVPEGYALLPDTDSAAPGFSVDNIFVLAGIPEIMKRMFHALSPLLPRSPYHTCEVYSPSFEGEIADTLTSIQNRFPEVSLGCYPSVARHKAGGHPVRLVLSAADRGQLEAALEELRRDLPVADDDGLPAKNEEAG